MRLDDRSESLVLSEAKDQNFREDNYYRLILMEETSKSKRLTRRTFAVILSVSLTLIGFADYVCKR